MADPENPFSDIDPEAMRPVESDADWAIDEMFATREVGEGKIEFSFEAATPSIDMVAADHRVQAEHHMTEYYANRTTNPELAALHQAERYKHIGWAATLERKSRGIE